jgi:cytochrome b subunit of formate dehydrogenase
MPVQTLEPAVEKLPVEPAIIAAPKPEKPEKTEEKEYVRFTVLNRTLHLTMMLSFIVLALTGLSLKFSYTAWAVKLSHWLGGFETAGLMHRIAAFVMFGTFGTHLVDILRVKRQERWSWRELVLGPGSMMFTLQDVRDFIATVKWFIGLGPRPRYGRWTYWEKFDYFAVFWGMFAIGFTGLMLWFPLFFTRFLPGSLLNVATIVHSDEALLAVGFIFTIHFFNTHLRPEKFPMDSCIFTGQMTLEELKRDKPREYEQMVASGQLEKSLAAPQSARFIKVCRVFGWTVLTLGLAVVLLIAYAMIFAHA